MAKIEKVDLSEALTLPDNIVWQNRFNQLPLKQSAAHALDGALIIQSRALAGGRPLELSPFWLTYQDLTKLFGFASTGGEFILTLPTGEAINVVFDGDQPINAAGVIDIANPDPSDKFELTVKFLTV
ncbi:MAG: hypothetical protein CMB99_16420 [Flavobacteriaceae bacterium]|nr:hypothetical protein [Flavobacteriaceae bacterium]|tara:strand:- start:26127 stop:26507 length:381 start_codon:yes stop_codon:yes gene_type:complete